jgi:hypothetical protein
VTVVAAVAFGLLIGYLAWANDSFPTREGTFADYATVTSTQFNGTEMAFWVQWTNSDYLPYQAQLTSAVTDAANTDVCGLGLSNVTVGQTLFMPFAIATPTPVVTSVDLSIAVQSMVNGTRFTIDYIVPNASAQNGDIMPSNIACQQEMGVE